MSKYSRVAFIVPFYVGVLFIGFLFLILARVNRDHPDRTLVREALRNGAVIVDVRSIIEFESGHFELARNIPEDDLNFFNRVRELQQEKNVPIVLYSHSGGESASAVERLSAAGFTSVIDGGSVKDLRDQGIHYVSVPRSELAQKIAAGDD